MKRLLLLLLVNLSANGVGFPKDTLIKTIKGYVEIQNLKEKDIVYSFDFNKSRIVENEVVKVSKYQSSKLIYICYNKTCIAVDEYQKIYCPLSSDSFINKMWIRARDIKPWQFILTNDGLAQVKGVYKHQIDIEVYDLALKSNHTFLVTKDDILVHNYVPILVWVAGEGVTVCWAGVAIVGSWIAIKSYQDGGFKWHPDNDSAEKLKHIFNNPNSNHNFNGKDPKDIMEKIKKMLEAAFKGGKLKNGEVFKESIQIGPNEILTATGKVVEGCVRLGTAFINKMFGV